MKRYLSVDMAKALKTWKPENGESQGQTIARIALRHSVSASGLYRALIKSGQISKQQKAT